MSPLLVVQAVDGPLRGDRWVLSGEPLYLGRDPSDCGVLLPRTAVHVSRLHASLQLVPDSRTCLLRDEGSKNGTFVDGTGRLDEGMAFPLEDGQRFWLGHRDWTFVIHHGEDTGNA